MTSWAGSRWNKSDRQVTPAASWVARWPSGPTGGNSVRVDKGSGETVGRGEER
jgi:hypothetical protein